MRRPFTSFRTLIADAQSLDGGDDTLHWVESSEAVRFVEPQGGRIDGGPFVARKREGCVCVRESVEPRHAIYVGMVGMEARPTQLPVFGAWSKADSEPASPIYGEPPAVRRRSPGVVTRC